MRPSFPPSAPWVCCPHCGTKFGQLVDGRIAGYVQVRGGQARVYYAERIECERPHCGGVVDLRRPALAAG